VELRIWKSFNSHLGCAYSNAHEQVVSVKTPKARVARLGIWRASLLISAGFAPTFCVSFGQGGSALLKVLMLNGSSAGLEVECAL
jgi:hypothetical protein